MNFTIGSIKCFTQERNEIQREAVKHGYVIILGKSIDKVLGFGKNDSKRSQMLVQITGTLRNLANDDDSYSRMCKSKVVQKLIQVLEKYNSPTNKELMQNISRVLSKVSLDSECSKAIIATGKLRFLADLLCDWQHQTLFVQRIAFVLANLTTYFDEAREQIGTADQVKKIIAVSLYFFETDQQFYEDELRNQGRDFSPRTADKIANQARVVEDTLVKLIRLVANLSTEEQFIESITQSGEREMLNEFLTWMVSTLQRKKIGKSEEFILNSVSCATNLLFYDTPSKEVMFDEDLRIKIFKAVKMYVLETTNEELQIEAVRVLSNLSRHARLCEEFVTDRQFIEALILILDHTLRELVFYTIGIIINMTMHDSPRAKLCQQQPLLVSKLTDVLKDANIEDMDLAKVAGKALHNLAVCTKQEGATFSWSSEQIKRLDEIVTNLGEELDSIMDVANEEELEEIKGIRDLVNALINDMPENTFDCPDAKCGRKFKNQGELDKHVQRRHGSVK
ncbi:hypothetical protein FGO68_gene13245 [Halteria grandinella]|uniref:C2H2-type domain-containing protein n=1 Tax=Halteria grandinella TaxID=5974 RepID=A0A8J8NFV9_HALGN|nr:hypothetical protein FGO68_gene13245 [Halteria grandinella]